MQSIHIPYAQIDQLSSSDKAYAISDPALRPFYKYDVDIEAFAQVIEDKKKDNTDRAALHQTLQSQYASVEAGAAVQQNIDALLAENTFTVITAHQPSLFTGPLYFIYKTVTAINLARQLRERYQDYHFVPVFWLGSEDHDFEEINHLHLFNKTLTWENDEGGATGTMSTDSLQPVLAELKEMLGDSDNATHIFGIIERCYAAGKTYAQAAFEFVHELFKSYGLVVLLTNTASLKRAFIPYIEKELFERPSQALVESAQAEKEAAGFKAQAFARAINLFYLENHSRERIEWDAEAARFTVVHREVSFTAAEMKAHLEAHPERFSPNVVMRPIFQEVVLPNLCYIGGGGELAYWRERLTQFEYFGVNYPMLMRRNSVLWVDKGSKKKLDKLDLTIEALFADVELLVKRYVKDNTEEELSLANERQIIENAFNSVLEKATSIDPNMKRSVLGEMTKQLNALDKLEAKLISAEKRRHDTAIKQIRGLKDRLFPKNGTGLQERYDNFLQFYLKHGDQFIATLIEHLDPFNRDFVVLMEE